jgi:hypothetical protein
MHQVRSRRLIWPTAPTWGTSAPTNQWFFDPPQCRVITAVGEPDPARANAAHSYGFAAFSVDPGSRPSDTPIKVIYYDVVGPDGELVHFETFTLPVPAAISQSHWSVDASLLRCMRLMTEAHHADTEILFMSQRRKLPCKLLFQLAKFR